MMNKKFLLLFGLCFLSLVTFAQTTNEPTDVMRSYGKIYVVMAVCLTILLGLIGYVITTDRKISKLEKEMK